MSTTVSDYVKKTKLIELNCLMVGWLDGLMVGWFDGLMVGWLDGLMV